MERKAAVEYRIKDEWIDNMEILAKLRLTGKEREEAKQDMAQMLGLIDRLKEVDTKGVLPSFHVLPVSNVFREDELVFVDGREEILANAPVLKGGAVVVPKTMT